MNYPFGEHVVFTDSQPIFSFLTNCWNRIFPLSALSIISIVNLTMLGGVLAGSFFIYLILRKNLLPAWFAIIAANLITFLNPQFMRIRNHYALSYMFIVPATWYFLIRIFENRKSPKWYLVYIVFSLATGFIHPYHLTITAILMLAYTAVFMLQEFSRLRLHSWFLIRLFFTAITPLILFQIWLHVTDPINDRPKTPWGFLIYRANFESVFFPTEEPFKGFWRELFKTDEPIWEGYAYVGLLGLICLLLSLILVVRYASRLRFKLIFRPVLPFPLRIGIWAAILTLLFSMGIPFIFNLENLLEYLPPLKQFRSIGRFAWIFYYIFTVYVAFYFYRLYRYLRFKHAGNFALSFLFILFLIWGIDVKINVERKVRDISSQDGALSFAGYSGNYTEALALAHRNASDFQAILPLPFYQVGAEYYGFYPSSSAVYESMRASLNLHLPIATGMMSRTSLKHTLGFTQLLSSNMISKELIASFPSDKPLLLLVTPEDLTLAEKRLVSQGNLITTLGNITLYELPLKAFQPVLEQKAAEFEQLKPGLSEWNGIFTTTPTHSVIIRGFTDLPATTQLFDPGAATVAKGSLILFDNKIPAAQDTVTYEASGWYHLNRDVPLRNFKIRQYGADNSLLEEISVPIIEQTEIYKGWAKATLSFKLKDPANRIQVLFEGDGMTVDNLLIRPKYTDVYYYTNNGRNLILNNYQLK